MFNSTLWNTALKNYKYDVKYLHYLRVEQYLGSGGKARVSESKTKISKLESGTIIKGNEMFLPKMRAHTSS